MGRAAPAFEWLIERGAYSPVPDPIPHSLQETVRDAIDALGDEDRMLVEAKYYELCTYEEIAWRFGYGSKGAAYYRVRKALGNLREQIEERL